MKILLDRFWRARTCPGMEDRPIAQADTTVDSAGQCGDSQPGENVPITAENAAELVHFAWSKGVDLAIIGPEAPLAAGLADNLRAIGIRTFGPSQAAAQIESSKAFAKAFMERHGIPTARSVTFTDYSEALVRVIRTGGQRPHPW